MTSKCLFIVRLELGPTAIYTVPYPSIADCLTDASLRSLFDDCLVTRCEVLVDDVRVTAPPICTWLRFSRDLVAGAPRILAEVQS